MSTNQISFNACADSLTVSNTDTPSVDPAASFNFTGQLIILMLIQLGEIAYMTLVFFIMIAARHK
ncbi:MAG: Trk-type K+ transport system membrane component, partial [Paraglaciecola sp.]